MKLKIIKKAFIASLILFSYALYSQSNIKEVTIFHWNDLHAHDLPVKALKKGKGSKNDNYYYYGGISNMLGYLEKYRTPNSLVLNAGDDFQGSPISNFTRGKSQIEFLNLFNLDAFVIGNHEFDYSWQSLDTTLNLAKFDYLSANVYISSEEKTIGKPYIVRNINGVKFGIIGITAPDLEDLSLPQNLDGIVMLNTDSVIQAGINVLKNQKCNILILLTHIGLDNDIELAKKYYKDIDIIVGGHSHTPLQKPVNQNGVIIVQAGAYSRYLGELDLKIDIDKDTVIGYYGKLIETVMDSSIYDKSAQQKAEQMIASIGPELNRVIGTLESDWKAGYSVESNLGQFEAEVFRKKTTSDIGMINGGGLRKSLLKGDITVSDIWEINPFGNDVVTFEVSGSILKEMIANNTKLRVKKKEAGGYMEILELAGLSYEYNSKKIIQGSTDFIGNVFVNDSPVDDNKIYKISTNNYVSSQFKKFFGEVSQIPQFKDTGLIDRDVIIEAVENEKNINSILEKRIVDTAN